MYHSKIFLGVDTLKKLQGQIWGRPRFRIRKYQPENFVKVFERVHAFTPTASGSLQDYSRALGEDMLVQLLVHIKGYIKFSSKK